MANTCYFTVTVASAQVATTITDFEIGYNLANLGSGHGYWTHGKSDGGDLRVYSDAAMTTRLPLEVVWVDISNKKGYIFFKGDISSSTNKTYYVAYGDSSLTQPAVTDTYGRNAVWSRFGSSGFVLHNPYDLIDSTGNTSSWGRNGTYSNSTSEDAIGLGESTSLSGSTSAIYTTESAAQAAIESQNTFQFAIHKRTSDYTSGNLEFLLCCSASGGGSPGGSELVFLPLGPNAISYYIYNQGYNAKINVSAIPEDGWLTYAGGLRDNVSSGYFLRTWETDLTEDAYTGMYDASAVGTSGTAAGVGVYHDYSGSFLVSPGYYQEIRVVGSSSTSIPEQNYAFEVAKNFFNSSWITASAEVASAKSISCESGAFVLTGQAAGLKRGYYLSCESGSFALAGQDAQVKKGWKLPCASGALTLEGQSAGLYRGYYIGCASGAYAISGQDAGVSATRRLSCDSGSFALSGQAAGLFQGKKLACASGAFTLSLTSANIRKQWKLPCESGGFTLSLTAGGMLYGYKLACDSGTFVLTGGECQFPGVLGLPCESGSFTLAGSAAFGRYNRIFHCDPAAYTLGFSAAEFIRGSNKSLSCEGGVFTCTGSAASFQLDRYLSCELAAFDLTLQDSGLIYRKALPCASGEFAVSYTAAGLYKGYKISCASREFVLQAVDVNLKKGFGIACASGTFSVSYTSNTLRRGYVLSAESGAFVLDGTSANINKSGVYIFNCEGGEFNITPSIGTQFLKQYNLASGSGKFKLKGADANLTDPATRVSTVKLLKQSTRFLGDTYASSHTNRH